MNRELLELMLKASAEPIADVENNDAFIMEQVRAIGALEDIEIEPTETLASFTKKFQAKLEAKVSSYVGKDDKPVHDEVTNFIGEAKTLKTKEFLLEKQLKAEWQAAKHIKAKDEIKVTQLFKRYLSILCLAGEIDFDHDQGRVWIRVAEAGGDMRDVDSLEPSMQSCVDILLKLAIRKDKKDRLSIFDDVDIDPGVRQKCLLAAMVADVNESLDDKTSSKPSNSGQPT